jgi:hypothetical protein
MEGVWIAPVQAQVMMTFRAAAMAFSELNKREGGGWPAALECTAGLT